MRARLGTVIVAAFALAATIGAPTASAAVEIGDECSGTEAEGPYSLVPEARASGGSLPLAASAAGVVTSWKVNSSRSEPVPERMAVFRPTGAPGTFQAVGESNDEIVQQGANTFSTRIPIQVGDRVGPVAVTIDSPLFCVTADSGDTAWGFVGSVGVGSTHTFIAVAQIRVPLVAVIEPDKDGDGYGDETQDGCPQSAASHTACPTITLDAFPIVLKRSVLVLVGASSEASVQVIGQVDRGKIIVPRSAHSSKRRPSKPVTQPKPSLLLTGGTQTVVPGQVARFNVRLPQAVMRRLRELPPKKSLKATITAFTTDLAGRLSKRTITIRLRSQAKARP